MGSMVALSKIRIPDNIRTVEGVDDWVDTPLDRFPLDEKASILQLAETIREYGLLQPVMVKDLGRGKFRLLDGCRRYKAVQYNHAVHGRAAVIDTKPVKGKTEDESIVKVIANLHRKNLNPLDMARALVSIQEAKGITRRSELANVVKKSKGWVTQHLSLLKADPSLQEAVGKGEMGLGAARSISSLPKHEQKSAVVDAKEEADKAGKKKVSTKGAKRQAAKKKKEKKDKQQVIRPVAEREIEQKETLCTAFLDVHYGDTKKGADLKESREVVSAFWDFLMGKDRLYIKP